ncbi:MAG: hypothetical protein HYT88_03185 [Candidatus Omnitrophica bacterium]|nr:hypothetical protein [Candidatus Omnitrophota bacterium]
MSYFRRIARIAVAFLVAFTQLPFIPTAFADPTEVNVNNQLVLLKTQTPPSGSTPAGGIYPIKGTFKYTGTNPLTNLFFRVRTLRYNNGSLPPPELVNADRGGTGVGAEKDVLIPSGGLLPNTTFTITFDIKLPRIAKFTFLVDAFTQLTPEPPITPTSGFIHGAPQNCQVYLPSRCFYPTHS